MEISQVSRSTAGNRFWRYGPRGITVAAALLAVGGLNLASGQLAEAQGGGVWDLLAGCESGGRWYIDTGNGFSGGLQLAHSTWQSFGGSAYASRAARASRAQQIKVAERVLAHQGWDAWPACSASLRLKAVQHGAPRTTTAAHSGRQGRIGAPTRARLRQAPQKRPRIVSHGSTAGSLIVNKGDTMSGLAYVHGCDWQEFYRLNRKVIGMNPNLIYPGTRLALPRQELL